MNPVKDDAPLYEVERRAEHAARPGFRITERFPGTQLAANGYRALQVADRGDGITRHGFAKRGEGRVNISATPEVGTRPAHPRSVGVLSIDWPSAPAPRVEAGAPNEDDAAAGPAAG